MTPEDLFDLINSDLGCKKGLLTYAPLSRHPRRKAVSLVCLCTPACPIVSAVTSPLLIPFCRRDGGNSLPGDGWSQGMCSGSLLTSHNFPLDFITQGKVLVCFVGFFSPLSVLPAVLGSAREVKHPSICVSSNWPTSCILLVTAGASVTKGKGDRTQNPISS